jgi:NADPH:quinone reductase-like Zn-dependent oxidoreductase
MPHIGGSDIAGVVDTVGDKGTDGEWVGKRVVADPSLGYEAFYAPTGPRQPPLRMLGEHTNGGFAEYTIAPVANLLELPSSFEFETAAAAPLCSVTAWRAVTTRGKLQPGEHVMVTGASGGVATVSIQLAARLGAVVHAVTSGPANVERARSLGAHRAYDRLTGDFVTAIKQETDGRGVDLVIDSVGEATWQSSLRVLSIGGRLVSYGATAGPRVTVDLRHLFWKQQSILGTTMGTPGEFRKVMELVFRGEIVPVVHEVLPLEEARRAHEMLEGGGVFGKLVLAP